MLKKNVMMRRFCISFFCYVAAILSTIAATFFAGWASVFLLGPIWGRVGFVSFLCFTFAWIVIDHKRHRIWRYYTGLPGKSSLFLLFFLVFGWTIVVPWYLGLRFRIIAGTAQIRDEY